VDVLQTEQSVRRMRHGGGTGPEAKALGKAQGYADGATDTRKVESKDGANIMGTPATGVQEWRGIPWAKVERDTYTLQQRIYQASLRGDVNVTHRLQRLMISSWQAKCLAVRRVTQDNQGKKTAGVDGIKSLTPLERLRLAKDLSLDARPSPTRRVWIPKPGTEEKRPLGIFTATVTTKCTARTSSPRHRAPMTRDPVSEEPYERESLKYGFVDQYAGRPAC